MAKDFFGNTPSEPSTSSIIDSTNPVVDNAPTSVPSPKAAGFVAPTINDYKSPIVVFVGPAASGKSMILVRLAKYLRNRGFIIEPDTSFVGTNQYVQDCAEFKSKLSTDIALDGTVKHLLVSVRDKERNKIAQLLEAPGEDFFNPKEPTNPIPPYLNTIMASQNRKTYVIILDLDSKFSLRNHQKERGLYAQRLIEQIYPNIHKKRDRIILLYNKIDMTGFATIHGMKNLTAAKEDSVQLYPMVYNSMKKKFFGGLIELDDFVFKPFCTGVYTDQTDQNGNAFQTYVPADDCYPKDLWQEIIRKW